VISSPTDALILERHDAAAVVVLNRPESINAINNDLRANLPALVRQLDQDASVAAIIIAGNGERGFCAGADIKEARPPQPPAGERRRLTPSWIDDIAATTKPVIAAIHGVCMGAGLELALACDLRIAAAGARLALPETALGLIPGGGGTQRLARLIGQGLALDMILTGRVLDADAALAAGLVSRVAESREVALAAALAIAAALADRPPLALAYAKEAVIAGGALPLAEGLRLEKTLFAILAATRDRQEAVQAFREKRKPRFSGE
jgi:enoyl-CoA hydratase